MENEQRIVELLAGTLLKQDLMIAELSGVKSEITGVKSEIIKLNLQSTENTRAIFKLATMKLKTSPICTNA